MLLQTNNRIVHVMIAKLSLGFNSDITRQIKKAFFQAHLHSLKNRTRNVHDQIGTSLNVNGVHRLDIKESILYLL